MEQFVGRGGRCLGIRARDRTSELMLPCADGTVLTIDRGRFPADAAAISEAWTGVVLAVAAVPLDPVRQRGDRQPPERRVVALAEGVPLGAGSQSPELGVAALMMSPQQGSSRRMCSCSVKQPWGSQAHGWGTRARGCTLSMGHAPTPPQPPARAPAGPGPPSARPPPAGPRRPRSAVWGGRRRPTGPPRTRSICCCRLRLAATDGSRRRRAPPG